jgi:hypothetical protein
VYEQHDAAGLAGVKVDVHAGHVAIKSQPGSSVLVTGRRVAEGRQQQDLEGWLQMCQVELTENPGQGLLLVRDVWPAGVPPWQEADGTVTLELTVEVPLRFSLDANVGVGSLRAEGEFGELKMHSGVGSLTARTESREASLTTGSGNILWSGVAGPLNLEAGTGSLTARGRAADTHLSTDTGDLILEPFDAEGAALLTATTGAGRIQAELTALPARSPEEGAPTATFRAQTGDVLVRFAPRPSGSPGEGGARVQATTGTGSVHTDFSLTRQVETNRGAGGSLTGVLGAGACEVIAGTLTGNITVGPLTRPHTRASPSAGR